MNTSRWLNWGPRDQKFYESAKGEPTKPYKTGFDGFVGADSEAADEIPTLEDVLKGRAVELSLVGGDRLFIVADEEDAAQLGEPRGSIYTAAEVRRVLQVIDPALVAELHRWKREFNATVRDVQTGPMTERLPSQ